MVVLYTHYMWQISGLLKMVQTVLVTISKILIIYVILDTRLIALYTNALLYINPWQPTKHFYQPYPFMEHPLL